MTIVMGGSNNYWFALSPVGCSGSCGTQRRPHAVALPISSRYKCRGTHISYMLVLPRQSFMAVIIVHRNRMPHASLAKVKDFRIRPTHINVASLTLHQPAYPALPSLPSISFAPYSGPSARSSCNSASEPVTASSVTPSPRAPFITS